MIATKAQPTNMKQTVSICPESIRSVARTSAIARLCMTRQYTDDSDGYVDNGDEAMTMTCGFVQRTRARACVNANHNMQHTHNMTNMCSTNGSATEGILVITHTIQSRQTEQRCERFCMLSVYDRLNAYCSVVFTQTEHACLV